MKNSFIFNQIKKDFLWDISYKITFFGQFAGMILTLVTFFFLSKTFELSNSPYLQNYENNYFLFSIIGIAFLDHISFFIRSSSLAIRNAQAFGYIDNIVNSNRNIFYVFLSMLLYPYIKGNLKFLIYIFFAAFFTSFELSLAFLGSIINSPKTSMYCGRFQILSFRSRLNFTILFIRV